MYILTTANHQRLLINKNEYDGLIGALNEDKKFVVMQGHVISLALAPSVSPFANWYATEAERLAVSGKRLCKICLKIMGISDKCGCWEVQGLGKKQDAFVALPDELKQLAHGAIKSFPKLTEEDKFRLESEEALRQALPEHIENKNGQLGYVDEAGEEQYS